MDTHRIRNIAISTPVALSLVLGAAACSKSDDKSDKQQTTTTKADSGTSDTTAGTSDDTTSDDTTAASSGGDKELGNPQIKAELSESHPDLWAKVDYNRFQWSAFGGFHVIVSGDTTVDEAMKLCDALSALVYNSDVYKPQPESAIVIATSDDKADFEGTPVVQRENAEGTCAPV